MKRPILRPLTFILSALCAVCLLASSVRAATAYFACPGSALPIAGGTYSWDDPNIWSTVVGCTSAGAWVPGGFARFHGGVNYTIVANNPESMAGLFDNTDAAGANTLTLTNAGSGAFDLVPNSSLTLGMPIQGFFTAGGTVLIYCPITGTGGVGENSGGGNLELLGTNTYSGGTVFNSSGTLTYFNNDKSFGTGPIVLNGTSFAPILGTGGHLITLANNWTNQGACGVVFAADASTPVTLTGPWTMTGNLNLRNNGGPSSPLSLLGGISGAFNITLSANNGGATTIIFGLGNTYSGQTIISGSGTTGVTLSAGRLNSVSGGSPNSSLGHPTTVANGTIAIGGGANTSTLIFNGAGETTDRVIDLAGTTGGAVIQSDATSGPLSFTSAFTATGAGSKTLTLQGASTFQNTIAGAIVNNSAANKTAVVKAQTGTWSLAGVNTYSGGTTITGGTLAIAGSISGNVTNNGGILELDSATALSGGASAIVNLITTVPGSVKLLFSGSQTLNALYFAGVAQATGTWGAVGSGADHESSIFLGSGKLNVLGAPVVVTQPQSAAVWPGGSATFSVTALGSPSYQWKRNGANVGANTSSLTINPAGTGDAGTYVCWMTNSFGWTNTSPVTLTVRTVNNYTAAVLGDSPISYWRLDEADGTTAYDAVGSNNGTYINVIPNKTPGYSTIDGDACVNLQKMPLGQGSFVSVANYNAFNFFTNASPTFTLEAWAYFTNIAGVQRIFSTDRNTTPLGYMFGISGANQLLFTTANYMDYYMPPTGSLASPLQENVWYHLVLSCDGGALHYYVNGQPVGTYTLQTPPRGGTNGAPMCLGANGDFLSSGANDNSEQLKGYLDEVAIYGTFLGDGQVLAHYNASLPNAPAAQTAVADQPTNYVSLTTTFTMNAVGQDLHYQWSKVGSGDIGSDSSTLTVGPLSLGDAGSYRCLVSNTGGSTNPPPATLTVLPIPTTASQVGLTNDLVLHLPLDGDYLDISGHHNNGTSVNTPALPTDSPKVGTGYLQYSSTVGGPYNYVTLGKPADLLFGPTGNFSVAFWVRQTGRYTNLPFFGNATNSTGRNLGFAIAPGLAPDGSPIGAWAWSFFDGTIQDYATGDQDSIADNNWHHLTFVFDRSSSATVYLDGKYVSSVNDSYLGGVDSGATFNIGQDPTGAYNVDGQADLDDIGVWKRALTQLEVSGMYLAGANNTPGVSFAPVLASVPTATTVGSLSAGATTLSYSGGGGSQFVLVGTNNVAAPLANWTRIHTNFTTPGSFTIPAVGSGAGPMFYRVKSE